MRSVFASLLVLAACGGPAAQPTVSAPPTMPSAPAVLDAAGKCPQGYERVGDECAKSKGIMPPD